MEGAYECNLFRVEISLKPEPFWIDYRGNFKMQKIDEITYRIDFKDGKEYIIKFDKEKNQFIENEKKIYTHVNRFEIFKNLKKKTLDCCEIKVDEDEPFFIISMLNDLVVEFDGNKIILKKIELNNNNQLWNFTKQKKIKLFEKEIYLCCCEKEKLIFEDKNQENENQKWELKDDQIINCFFKNKCLDISGNNFEENAEVIVWDILKNEKNEKRENQMWKLIKRNKIHKKNNNLKKPIIKIIGIGGASGCGKSFLADKLNIALNCPLKSISIDSYFHYFKNLPNHPIYGKNLELPIAIDVELFKDDFNNLLEKIEKNYSFYEEKINLTNIKNLNNEFYFKNENNPIVYIILEGYLLYYFEEICNLIDIKFFIESENEICRERRFKRDGKYFYSKKEFDHWYDNLVWHHYLEFKDVQLSRNPIILKNDNKLLENCLCEIEKLFFVSQKLTILKINVESVKIKKLIKVLPIKNIEGDKTISGEEKFENLSDYEKKCIGTLVGCCIGDILGRDCEVLPNLFVENNLKKVINVFTEFNDNFVHKFGTYTDDTALTLAIVDSIIENKCLDFHKIGENLYKVYKRNVSRGYGSSTKKIMDFIEKNGTEKVLEKSKELNLNSNGSLMRCSSIGLVFRNCKIETIYEAAKLQSVVTHYGKEAVDSCFLLCYLISILCKKNSDEIGFIKYSKDISEKIKFINDLIEMSEKMKLEIKLIEKLKILVDCFSKNEKDIQLIEKIVKYSLYPNCLFHIAAVDAIVTSIWFFMKYFNNPVNCMTIGVSFGGDADTIGSILGSLLGSLYDINWIPKRFFNNIENDDEKFGRDSLIDFGIKISKFDFNESSIKM